MQGITYLVQEYSSRIKDFKLVKIISDNRGIIFQEIVGLAELGVAHGLAGRKIDSIEDIFLMFSSGILAVLGGVNIGQSFNRGYNSQISKPSEDILTGVVYSSNYDTFELSLGRHLEFRARL